MPRLPTRDDLSQAPSARSGRPIATYDVTAIGEAQARAGKQLTDAAATVLEATQQRERHQQRQDEYDAELKLQEFKWGEILGLEDAQRNAQPGQAGSFADDWTAGHRQRAQEFQKGLSESARRRVGLKLGALEKDLWRDANIFGRTEQKRSAIAALGDFKTRYDPRPGNLERGRADFEGLVDANPWLTPIEKDEEKRKGLRDIEELHVKGLIDQGRDLDAIIRDLGGGPELDTQDNPETRAKPMRSRAVASGPMTPISVRLETGQTDPMKGVANISKDSNGSRSYGNFGLNSQGSAQAFVKDYGDALGLTGEPGTAAFDRSWKEVAKADPEGLHQAEMAWYGKTVTGRVGADLGKAGVAEDVAADPRVQAYFADRLVQYGPASIDNHSARVKAAYAKSGGDPERFLREMSEADRDSMSKDFPSALKSGVYSQRGHDNRVYGRLNLALAGGVGGAKLPGADAYKGPYSHLGGEQRVELLKSARAKLKTGMEAGREQLKRALDDDVESIRRTGVSTKPDVERAAAVLEPNQVNRYHLDRVEAAAEYDAMKDLPSLPDAAIQARLAELEPAPGELGFDMRAKVYDKIKTAVDGENGIRRLREDDPARAVEAVPEVKAATEALRAAPDDPGALQTLTRARLDAQAKVGIPEGIRAPISKAEAKIIASPLKGLEGKALTEAIGGWRETLDQRYGPYARAVALSAIDQAITRDKELAEVAESQINRLLSGQRPSAALVRRGEFIADVNAATGAMGVAVGDPRTQYGPAGAGRGVPRNFPASAASSDAGQTGSAYQETPFQTFAPLEPPPKAIEFLRTNPATAAEFDLKFGRGQSSIYLAPELAEGEWKR